MRLRSQISLLRATMMVAPVMAQETPKMSLDEATRATVLIEVTSILESVTFVPGVNFDEWDAMVKENEEQLNGAKSPEDLAVVVNQMFQKFGENCAAGEDWWPKMIMLKVLQQYYSATRDPRVITFMTNYFRYQLKAVTTCKLGKCTEWAVSRGPENVMMIQWLYNITKEKSLLDWLGSSVTILSMEYLAGQPRLGDKCCSKSNGERLDAPACR